MRKKLVDNYQSGTSYKPFGFESPKNQGMPIIHNWRKLGTAVNVGRSGQIYSKTTPIIYGK